MSKKESGFWKEFKDFVARGNVMDMAVGIVVGSAFTAIVTSLVQNVINPIIGLATGGVDFGALKIILRHATEEKPELAIGYGLFINAIINFLIIALVVFCLVRSLNRLKEQAEKKRIEEEKAAAEKAAKEAAAKAPAEDPQLTILKEILAAIKK